MVFLDTKIIATPISEVVITTDIYSKKTDTHQYLNPNSCHPKSQIIRILARLIEYKAYLMKSGHNEKDIDNAFCNRFLKNRREILKKKANKNLMSMNHHCQTFTPHSEKIVTY